MFKKILSLILSVSLILTQPIFAQGVAELNIGKYLNQMPAVKTDSFRPARLRYVSYDVASNDFKLLLDQGDAKLSNSLNSLTPKLQDATQELFNYFLIGLSLPNDKFWVNLRPDAPQQIIDPLLEKTDMGKIMLEADLQLKKDTASLTSPQNPEGKEYWDKLYKKSGELFGTENITIPTITRPWIVPGEVIIRESEDSAYIYKANLKVMLEEDYLRGTKPAYRQGRDEGRGTIIDYSFNDPRMKELNKYSTQLIKELILPKLTQEINTSKKYAQLRQVFFSLILSRWFKDKFKDKPGQYSSLIDSRNLDKLNSKEGWNKEYYFNEYKKSFRQGEYNLKEQVSTPTGQAIRSYVSGGANLCFSNEAMSGYKVPKTSSSALSDEDMAKIAYGIFFTVLFSVSVGAIKIMHNIGKQGGQWHSRQISLAKDEIHKRLPGRFKELRESENLTEDDYRILSLLLIVNKHWGLKQLYKKGEITLKDFKLLSSFISQDKIWYHEDEKIENIIKYLSIIKPSNRKIIQLKDFLTKKVYGSSPLTQKEAKKGFNKSFGNLDRNYGDNSSADEQVKTYWKQMYTQYLSYVNYTVDNKQDLKVMEAKINELEQSVQGIEKKEGSVKFITDLNEFMGSFKAWRDAADQELSLQERESSSSLTQELPQNNSAPLTTGGIDFTRINYLTRPMGSFQGLDLRLPLLSKAELEGIDINKELASVEQMVNAKIEVSTDRLKRLLAAMSQKDAFTSQRETQLLPLFLRLCWLKEEKGSETTSDFRAVLLIADTGLFVEQGNAKYSLN